MNWLNKRLNKLRWYEWVISGYIVLVSIGVLIMIIMDIIVAYYVK